MLSYNFLLGLFVSVVIVSLIEESQVHAAPEPCRELLDLMIKPGKTQKLKNDEKEKDNKHKRKKENIRELKKVLEMLRHPKKESEEVEVAKPKGVLEEMMTSYFNFLKYLMQL